MQSGFLQSSRKVQDNLTKTGIFAFCPAKTFSLSVKCPVNLSKENNILTTNMPSVPQILICPAKDYSLSDSCPASAEKISRRLFLTDLEHWILFSHAIKWTQWTGVLIIDVYGAMFYGLHISSNNNSL